MSDDIKKDDENLGSFYMGRMRPPPEPSRRIPRGVLTSFTILAFVIIIWYAYPRGAEKYTDIDVPVVQADPTPIKSIPENTEGMEVRHQDSTVFDPLENKPAGEVETLRPVPEEPVNKAEAIQESEDKKPVIAAKMHEKMNLDLQMKEVKDGVEKVVSKAAEAKEAAKAETAPVAEKTIAKAEVKPAAKTEPKTEVKPAVVVNNGKTYIQLGAYSSVAIAKKEWAAAKAKHPALLGSLDMRTESVKVGSKTLIRLQAGKLSPAKAKETCDALKQAKSSSCIVVK
jgi:hypothetical protein